MFGDEDFVARVLAESDERLDAGQRLQSQGIVLDRLGEIVAQVLDLASEEVWAPGRFLIQI